MNGKRSRTVSISLRERGQTTQDFAVGIGIFLLAMAFVFSYVPTLLTPFSAGGGTGDTAQADRIAATVLENVSEGEPNHVNASAFEEKYNGSDSADLIDDLGLRSADNGSDSVDRVNVTFEPLNESESYGLSAGDDYKRATSTASAGRIVTVSDPEDDLGGECEPACRLVVRVW